MQTKTQRRQTNVAKRTMSTGERWRRRLPLLPALVITALITLVPFLGTIWYSFHSWNMVSVEEPRFVGLENYVRMLTDPDLRNAVWVTVLITALTVATAAAVGLGLALLVNRTFPGRGVVRTLLITPFLVMPTALALLWKNSMLDPLYGFFNLVLGVFGIAPVDWLGQHPILSVVLISVYQWTPFMMLILLGGLQSQSEETLEAAKVDGCRPHQVFRFITLPHLRQFIEIGVVLGSIFVVQTFDVIFMSTGGGPGQATTNLPYMLYMTAFRRFEIGQASALGVVVVVLTIVVASFALRYFTRLVGSSEEK